MRLPLFQASRSVLRCTLALLALTLIACASSAPRAPSRASAPPNRDLVLEIFGTRQLTLDRVLATCGDDLRALATALERGTPDLQQRTETVMAKLESLGDFADISFAPVAYPKIPGKYYLTIDFVDTADAARRMPFSPIPSGSYPDPESLIADWRAYEPAQLARSEPRVACPAFHCLGDHRHPSVAPIADRIAARAPAHLDELAAIARDDRDGRKRSAAIYLLAYTTDGPALVRELLPAFRDSDMLVRNNAMRVMSDIAYYHPEVEVPLEPALEALDYPTTLDRNKSAAIIFGLLSRPGSERLHRTIVLRGGSHLLAMLRLEQPNNHDFAYWILKIISGKSFGERDYAAWEEWLRAELAAPLDRRP